MSVDETADQPVPGPIGDVVDPTQFFREGLDRANRIANAARHEALRSLVASLLISSLGFLGAMFVPVALLASRFGSKAENIRLAILLAVAESITIIGLTLYLRRRNQDARRQALLAEIEARILLERGLRERLDLVGDPTALYDFDRPVIDLTDSKANEQKRSAG